MSIHLVPAYGRDYNSVWEAKEAVLSGADFKIVGGPYCSIRDFNNMEVDYGTILLMFNKGSMTTDVTSLRQ